MICTVPVINLWTVTVYGYIWYTQTLRTYLKTRDVPYSWVDARGILLAKSEFLGVGLVEKGSSESTRWVVLVYGNNSSRMEG